ncbi:nodal modulator [Chamberlinius hualienensis]
MLNGVLNLLMKILMLCGNIGLYGVALFNISSAPPRTDAIGGRMWVSYQSYFIFFCAIYTSVTNLIYCQDVLGCGGFIKSEYPIDFSLVDVKLYTKQGALKFQTDCAPNNGYYLIPVYDKGDYVIKVEPPEGWYFEPTSVSLQIDGNSDVCSQAKDINFYFKGFKIEGKLLSRGSAAGPSGVPVILANEKDPKTVIKQSITKENGLFEFEEVFPGKYIISGSHNELVFERKSTIVEVAKGIVKLSENNLIVDGYPVKGCVIGDDGEAIHGVHFILFGNVDAKLGPKQCEKGLPKSFDSKTSQLKSKLTPLCHVTSMEDGCFTFPVVVPGSYEIVPFYRSHNIKFDVVPFNLPLTVQQSSINIKPEFKVEGFSVGGRVLSSAGGKGVPNANVLLNGKSMTKTKDDGSFHLENMRAGSYQIEIQADKIRFEVQSVKINPNSPNLPDIVAAEFEVCGELDGDEIAKSTAHQIKFVATKQILATNTPDGKFCTWLPSGTFVVSVDQSRQDTPKSIIFTPRTQQVAVKDKPVSNIKFFQFKATVVGQVDGLEPIGDLVTISLNPLEVSNYQVVPQQARLSSGKFALTDVIPGKYEISILNENWCWETKVHQIEIVDANPKAVVFKHKGYWMTISTTHDTSIQYQSEELKKPQLKDEALPASPVVKLIDLQRGVNQFCLDKAGVYTIKTVGCHIFSNENYVFDTSKPTPLSLEAIRHLVSGTILSPVNSPDIKISVKAVDDEEIEEKLQEEAVIGPLTGKQRGKDDYEYIFSYWATPLKKIQFQPVSSELLFYPEKLTVSVVDDCIEKAAEFAGRKGLFLEGKINPPLEGVKITVYAEDGSIKPIILETTKTGSYRVGPLHGHSKYEVQAEKSGYILTKEKDLGHFSAFKLAEIDVTVVEDASPRPLPGVILSVSGGEDYRQNRLTQEDGKMVFSGLGPGQYFLRAMMKEYQFEPPSKMVEVSEGEGVSVVLKGKRVAFSCYGVVTSLIGEPEKGIVIEAIGKGDCSIYQEEVTSEEDGTFRIRGLKPNCEYGVGLKTSGGANPHIERSTPAPRFIHIKDGDVGPISLIVFQPVNTMDISGMVITPKEFYSHLKVRLSGENGTQQVRSLGFSNFFQFLSLPMRGQHFTLSLESTLSTTVYNYALPPEISFEANDTFRHFKFYFDPQPSGGEHEISHGSYLALPIVLLLALVLANHTKVVPFMNGTVDFLRSVQNNQGTRSKDENVSSSVTTSSSAGSAPFEAAVKKRVKSRKI